MSLPHRRRSRTRGPAKLAPVPDRDTEWLDQLRTDPADGATWPPDQSAVIFEGASDIGLMPEGVVAIKETGRDTQPLAKLRAQSPPAFGHQGYAPDATGPMAVIPLPPAIGDALARDEEWAPRFAALPCGHCGAPPPVQAGDVLDRARAIGHSNWRAFQDGWKHDTDLILTCPKCQEDDAWKARQGQLAVPGGPRHAAVLAVDVMLTSNSYPDVRTLFDAAERRNRKRFGFIRRGRHAGGAR